MKLKSTKRQMCEGQCKALGIFDRDTVRNVWVCRCCGHTTQARVPSIIRRLREELNEHAAAK